MHYRVMDSDLCVSKTLELDAFYLFVLKKKINCQLENIYYNLLHTTYNRVITICICHCITFYFLFILISVNSP